MCMDFTALEQSLNIQFINKTLLTQAFTHRSYLNEAPEDNIESNERLEFLGDTVLSVVISHYLYRTYSQLDEGHLTNLRSSIVSKKPLFRIAKDLGFGQYLLLSHGEEESGGRQNSSILADTCEAFIGALFLDQGLSGAQSFIERHFIPHLTATIERGDYRDFKSQLQEKIQAQRKESPVYKTMETQGPDHNKTFVVGVWAGAKLLATGRGKSKQEAQQDAARRALSPFPAPNSR